MKTIRTVISILSLCIAVQACRKEPAPGPDVKGEVILTLTAPDALSLNFVSGSKALVNGTAVEVVSQNGRTMVGVEKSSDGRYEVIYPYEAYSRTRKYFVLPPAQFACSNGTASAAFTPLAGSVTTSSAAADIKLEALAAQLAVNMKDAVSLASIRVEDPDGAPLSGTFSYDSSSSALIPDKNHPAIEWTVLNLNDDGSGTRGETFRICIPAGSYPHGLVVRATTSDHRCCSVSTEPLRLKAGESSSVTIDFSKSADILFEEHFDLLAWGGDPVEGTAGYGPTPGETNVAAASCTGLEAAYFPKEPSVAGTDYFDLTTYDRSQRESPTLKVSRSLLANMGLLQWERLFYVRAYQGFIGCDSSAEHANRPVIRLPRCLKDFRTVEISMNICTEPGFACDLESENYNGVIKSLTIDGRAVDVDCHSSTVLSQAASRYHDRIIIPRDMIGDGEWHTIKMVYSPFTGSDCFRILPTVVRGVKNCLFLDDVVIRATASPVNEYIASTPVTVPTTQKGSKGEKASDIRLQPSYCTGINSETIYSTCADMGMDWMCGGLPSDESQWETVVSQALAFRAKYGDAAKIWCSHLPYGNRGTARNRDLCVPDPDLHKASVNFYKRAIRAIAPMKPANVLIHCNQTLLPESVDGSSLDMMIQSLVEIVPVSDSIGAHIVVENMSWGVGSDVTDLCHAVDEANRIARPKYDIRIGMDPGHANLYLNTVGNRGTIVDWLREAGTRIGQLHVNGNRGTKVKVSGTTVSAVDDHLFPGYDGGYFNDAGTKYTSYFDLAGRNHLWGSFYKVLVEECLYRGPFNYESSTHNHFGEVNGELRYDHIVSPQTVADNFHNYILKEYLDL